MKIKSLKFLNDYKQFSRNQTFTVSSNSKGIVDFGDLEISIFVGRNGSGKTTLMSLIPTLFHHIERYNGKIPADFELNYSILVKKVLRNVIITHCDNLVRISIEGVYDNIQVLPAKNSQVLDYSVINKKEPYVELEELLPYLPSRVVISTFSLHGEYPVRRQRNFVGYQLVADQSITKIYGINHFEIGSISIGILRFIKLYLSNNKIKNLLKLFDLEFTNRVTYKEYGEPEYWLNVDKNWIKQKEREILSEEVFLNDIEFTKLGRTICLENMSSGEKMLLLRTISILNAIEKNSIIIIEEPELHLDQVWNRQLTTLFSVLYRNYNAHLLIATHDYSIINSVQKENLIMLKDGELQEITENTFLASFDELFRILFGEKFKTNKIEDDFINQIPNKSLEELNDIYTKIGNSVYKYLTVQF